MTNYDVFNGDADGICALQQLWLHTPKESALITGLKREIDLLSRVDASSGDQITVLDVSLEKNRAAPDQVLNTGGSVFYADHHFPGEIPEHQNLDVHIDVTADTCTSLIVNECLQGANARWAVVGAFGDNFDQVAKYLGSSIGLTESELTQLQQLRICLNYNGYGFDLDDLIFHLKVLFQMISPYSNPMDFVVLGEGYGALLAQFQTDMKILVLKHQMPSVRSTYFQINPGQNELLVSWVTTWQKNILIERMRYWWIWVMAVTE